MEIVGFRYAVTGAFGYAFYRGGHRLCTVDSLVVPSPTVSVRGFGGRWTSPFAQDRPPRPGTVRYLYCEGSGQAVCRLVYTGDRYDLHTGAGVYHAYTGAQAYVFYAGGQQAAALTRIPRQEAGNIPVPPDGPWAEGEAYYMATAAATMPKETLAAVLAFPMLRFDR